MCSWMREHRATELYAEAYPAKIDDSTLEYLVIMALNELVEDWKY